MWKHRDEGMRDRYMCHERMSRDNNDFCGCVHGAPDKKLYVFYAIADNDDLNKANWYCTYSAQKSSGWKKDFEDARIWNKRTPAKSKATVLGPSARIIEFHVDKVVVIDQTEHLKKVAEDRKQREFKRQQVAQELAIARAKEDIERATARLKALEGKKHMNSLILRNCLGNS